MAQPTASEQLMLELVNRARLDPAAEAARLGLDVSVSNTSKAPLAVSFSLVDAALEQARYQLDNGLENSTAGENNDGLYTEGTSGASDIIYQQHAYLFENSTARANILNANYGLIGIGQEIGDYVDNSDTSIVTQRFAQTGNIFLTGVIYDDTSGNNFYSIGEGRRNVDVVVGGVSSDSLSAGGYKQALSEAGVYAVRLDTAQFYATIGNENAKIDLVDRNHLESSVSLELLANVDSARLLGLDDLSLKGSTAAETLVGNKGDNLIDGKGGNDTIRAGLGEDTVRGGSGNDRLYGDSNSDYILGDDGDDFIDAGSGSDIVRGGAGADSMIGGTGHDELYGDADIDNMTGGDNNDLVDGGSGGDTLRGGSGNDQLIGGSGNDFLLAESGTDSLYGGTGRDQLTGGSGADSFIYKAASESTTSARDTIFDFSRSAGDKINLTAIDANANASGNQAFTYIGETGFTGRAGEFRIAQSGSDIYAYGDVNGDRVSDFSIHFDDLASLTRSDFLL